MLYGNFLFPANYYSGQPQHDLRYTSQPDTCDE